MAGDEERGRSGGNAGDPAARKGEKFRERMAQLKEVVPLLKRMPWRKIRAGVSRVPDIERFVENYRMYAPLLAEYKEALEKALESGAYRSFDLDASAEVIEVHGIDSGGNRKKVVIIFGHFWDQAFGPEPPIMTPL